MTRSEATLAVLAGGEGARMGRPKADLRIDDQPILAWLLDRFAWTGPTLLVTAPGREHPPGHERFSAEAVDPVSGQGPLRGVMSALCAISTPTVIITTLDMPGVGREQIQWLIERLDEHPGAMGLMTRCGEQIEPFPSIFRRGAIDAVQTRIAARQMSVARLGELPGFLLAASPPWDETVWTNLNTAADLDDFLRRAARKRQRQ